MSNQIEPEEEEAMEETLPHRDAETDPRKSYIKLNSFEDIEKNSMLINNTQVVGPFNGEDISEIQKNRSPSARSPNIVEAIM